MPHSHPGPTAERAWFIKWTATVQSKLTLYQQAFEDLHLRPGDLEPVIETGMCRDILSEAVRNQEAEWQRAVELLRSRQPLKSVIRRLFGDEVPVPVGLMALEEISRHDEGSERLDVAIACEVQKREAERRSLGLPTYVWVIQVGQQGKMSVSVRRRDEVPGRAMGLVRVMARPGL